MRKFIVLAVLLSFCAVTTRADDVPAPPALMPIGPDDEISQQMLDVAYAVGVIGPSEIYEVNESQPVRVLKIEGIDQTLLVFNELGSGHMVLASIRGSGTETEMRVWDGGPDEAVFTSAGIRIQPRADDANPAGLTPAANGVIENLACLGRALGIDFSNLSGSGLTNLISRASCSGASSIALVLTAANCLSIPHPMATIGCITGMTKIIACGYASCATCTVGSISRGNVLSGTFATSCRATHRSAYAKFYRFTLSSTTTVTIDLTSPAIDTYLYLLQGNGTNGAVIAYDDDSGAGVNARIVRTLGAGTYTIEATTYASGRTGAFTLSLR
jgi:hypothetical protein